MLPIHQAQLLSYMKLLDVPLGLLINFHEMKVTDGVSRLILPGANLRSIKGDYTGKRRKQRNGFSDLCSLCSLLFNRTL